MPEASATYAPRLASEQSSYNCGLIALKDDIKRKIRLLGKYHPLGHTTEKWYIIALAALVHINLKEHECRI